jgi:hypothetical protein
MADIKIPEPTTAEIRVANLLLNAFEIACRYDLQPLSGGSGRSVADRQNVAVSLVQWALGQKEQ